MSAKVMGWVFDAGPAEQAPMVVMLAIADNADDQGIAFPGIPTLARKTRMSERNVLRVVKELEVEGWMTVRRRSHKVQTERGSVRMGNTYCLNLARLKRSEVSDCTPDKVSSREVPSGENNTVAKPRHDKVSPVRRGDKTTRDEVTKTTRRGDKSALHILKNHQEPSREPKDLLILPEGGLEKSIGSIINGIAALRPGVGGAGDLHDQVEAYMQSKGFAAEREFKVPDRGDGHPGRVDLMCTLGEFRVAMEMDSRTARDKSLTKLKSLDAYRVIILRTAPAWVSYAGIDQVVAMNWPSNGYVPAHQAANELCAQRASVGSDSPGPAMRQPGSVVSTSEVRDAVRSALAGVRNDLQALDVDGSLLAEALAEWDQAFGDVSYDNHEVYEGATSGLNVRVSSPQPRATAAALLKYAHRIDKRLCAALGCRGSMQVVAAEGMAA